MGNFFSDYEKKNGNSAPAKSTGNFFADYEIAKGLRKPEPEQPQFNGDYNKLFGTASNPDPLKADTATANNIVNTAKKLPKVQPTEVESGHEFRLKAINNPETNPILRTYLKGVDAVMYSPFGTWNERAGQATNQTMFGSSMGQPVSTGNYLGDVSADVFGSVTGFMNPMGGGGALQLGEKAVAGAGARLLPKLAQKAPNLVRSTVGKVAGKAVQGFGGGAAYGTTMGLVNGESAGDVAQNALREGLTFGTLKGGSAMGRLPGALAGAGVFGGGTALQGGAPQDILTQGLVGGFMGGAGGKGKARKGATFTENPSYTGEVLPPLQRLGTGIKTGEGPVNRSLGLNATNPEYMFVDGKPVQINPAQPIYNRPTDYYAGESGVSSNIDQAGRRGIGSGRQPVGGLLPEPTPPDYYAGDAGLSKNINQAGRRLLPGGQNPKLLPDRFVKGSPDYYGSATGTISPNKDIVALYEQIKPIVSEQVQKMYVPGVKPAPDFISKVIDANVKAEPAQKAELVRLFTQQSQPKPKLPRLQSKNIGAADYKGQLKGYSDLRTARNEMQSEVDQATNGEAAYQYELQKDIGANDLWQKIRDNGGIKPYRDGQLTEEYKGLKSYVKNKDGLTMDEMADTLGYSSEAEFIADLHKQEASQKQTMTKLRENVDLHKDPRYRGMMDTIADFDKQMKGMEKNINPADLSKLDQMESAARERIARSKGRLNANPVQVWADYAIVGAAKIARGAVKYADWARDMLKDFGKVIEKRLPVLWKQAQQLHGKISKSRSAATAPPTDSAESFRAKVDRNPKAKKGSWKETYNELRTQFVDDLAPAERTEIGVTGKAASAEESLYKQARLFRGNAEKAHRIVKEKLGPILDRAQEKGITAEDLGDYALAVHARDLEAKGIKSGFTPAEISNVIRKYGSPDAEKARRELVKYSNDLLDDLVASGRISKQSVADMRAKHPNYVPFFRAFDDAKVEFSSGISRAVASAGNPIQKIKGSDRMVIDPLENIIKNTFKITASADKTRVMGQLERLASLDKTGDFVRQLKPGEEVGRKNVVKAFKQGKEIQYEVQPDLYRALKDMDKESADLLIKIMSQPAQLLRAGATLTPEFSLRNPMRDVPHAFIVSKSGFNPLDFGVGLVGAVARGRTFKVAGKEIKSPGELYSKFIMDNGGYGNVISMDRKLQRQVLTDAIKNPVDRKFVTMLNPLRILRAISDTTETATKVGEYRAALRSGASGQEAAYRARDIMDFARSGSSVRNLNKVVAFLNANIQGKSKTFRALKEDPTGVATRAAISLTLPTIGVFLAQKYLSNEKQKKIIDDAQGWMRSTFWLIPIPGTDQVARIPKPFDWAPVFANLPERFLTYLDKNDPAAFDGFAKETFASGSIPIMMTGLMPMVEGVSNYSWFRDAPIIPQREQKLNFSDQYDINTTETAKLIGKGFNKLTGGEGLLKNFSSPRVVDNAIQGTTAGLGKLATSGIDSLLTSAGIVKKPDKPAKSAAQLPIMRAFLVNDMSTGKALDNLYKENDRLSRAKSSAKLNRVQFKEGGRLNVTSHITERIGLISKRMRAIENDSKLDAATKRTMLEKLNEQRNELARQAMKRLKK